MDWAQIQDNWDHLRGISFPRLAGGSHTDVLLGADHFELMHLMKEFAGSPNGPCARLRLLGWTAAGKITEPEAQACHFTGFHHTFTENNNTELKSLL